MTFTIHGLIDDEDVQVTWTGGVLAGDKAAVDEVKALAQVLEGTAVGPEPDGPFTYANHLANPLSALLLIEDVFDDVIRRVGQLPSAMWSRDRRAA